MSLIPEAPRERLDALVERVGAGPSPRLPEPMVGGASTRRFLRVYLADGRSAVAMFVPEAASSDEITSHGDPGRPWPFLEIRQLLSERGVRVPKLLGESCSDGLLLVEDLGEQTLAVALEHHPEQRETLYRQAVLELARGQQLLSPLPEDSIVRQRSFDAQLLRWEVEHFREWALEAQGIELNAQDGETFERVASYLADTIAAWPSRFVHRDYQSRNLMVLGAGTASPALVWIDFQDALLGPRVYDLVALLNDSYQTFTREFVEARLDDFSAALGLDASERARLGYEFDFVTIQRKLKDAGRFIFIDRVKHNPSFLGFVEPTLKKIRATLRRLRDDPELAALEELLERLGLGSVD